VANCACGQKTGQCLSETTLDGIHRLFVNDFSQLTTGMRLGNTVILSHAGIGPLAEQITRRRTAAVGHIARLADNVPARLALRCQIDAS